MTIKTMEERITNRANERVQERIENCKRSINVALHDFFGDNPRNATSVSRNWPERHKKLLAVLISEDPSKGWPSSVWTEEENKVRTQLMAIMDEAQKALLARPPADDDCKPEGDV